MNLSSYNPYDRYRRRSFERMKNFGVVVILIALNFAFGFWIGGIASSGQIEFLNKQITLMEERQVQLETALTEVSAGAQTAQVRYEQLQESVAEAIPEGPMEDLVGLLKSQLDSGVDPKRLSFVIRSSRPPQNCTEPQTRRFVIATPAYEGPESKVEIADGAISVKGSGSSARNDGGDPEAWYDPTRKVSIDFVLADGRVEKKSGVMPLKNYLVVGGREYRFTIDAGTKSFAKVTFDSCDYP